MEISKGRPSCDNRTRVGRISKTFTPSITDPSGSTVLLITARRSEGFSCQRIPDNFSGGGVVLASFEGGSAGFFMIFAGASTSFEIVSRLGFFSTGEAGGFLLSTWFEVFGGTGLIFSRTSRPCSPEGGGGRTCWAGAGGDGLVKDSTCGIGGVAC
jgi:hypothetical protein